VARLSAPGGAACLAPSRTRKRSRT
jgi:hypothetical protein